MKSPYLILAIAGTIIPWIFFAGFIAEYGLAVPLFIAQVFATGPASGFAADLLICCAVFWIWSWRDAREYGVPNWWLTVPAVLLVGLSLALPLYLWMREHARDRRT